MYWVRKVEFFQVVCEKPGIFVQFVSYSAICAFIEGFDSAADGGALVGFQEWLLARGTRYTNLDWPRLVRIQAIANANLMLPPSPEEDQILISALRDALKGYARQREQGLNTVFHLYNCWLLRSRDPDTQELRDALTRVTPSSTAQEPNG